MKTFISYFLLALTVFSVATSGSAQGPVLDIDGDIIFTGSYYALPFVRGQGGGLTLAGRGDNPCPLDIVQESSELDEGLPIKFSNWKSRVGFVPLMENLNIETDVAATICMQPTYWWLDVSSNNKEQWFLTTGPKPEEFGQNSWNSYFQIIETEHKYVYSFMFCEISKFIKPFCSILGMFVDENGVRRLVLKGGKPFLVQFKKANIVIENM